MNYRFRAAKSFRNALAKLPPQQQHSAASAFKIFKQDPFDPRLRPHKIHRLLAAYGKTIYSVSIEGDLRATFYGMERRHRHSCDLRSLICLVRGKSRLSNNR